MQQPPADPGPLADVVVAIVNAYNNRDIPFFEKILARDVLWLDEDGHFIGAKEQAVYFIDEQLTAKPPRKLTISTIRSGLTGIAGDAAWAAFAYVIDDGVAQRKGVTSIVFRKPGGNTGWQAILIHGAIHAPAPGH
jgi:hypothetical protein